MHADKNLPLNEITERILGCAYEVANCLGSGFLEKVYENAVAHELRKAGLPVEQQRTMEVRYDGIIVGSHCACICGFNSLQYFGRGNGGASSHRAEAQKAGPKN